MHKRLTFSFDGTHERGESVDFLDGVVAEMPLDDVCEGPVNLGNV